MLLDTRWKQGSFNEARALQPIIDNLLLIKILWTIILTFPVTDSYIPLQWSLDTGGFIDFKYEEWYQDKWRDPVFTLSKADSGC